jgi:hypothetical protein
MEAHAQPPNPKTRARALCILFTSFACLVSAVIWCKAESLAVMDYIFIFGAPLVFGAAAYGIGLYVSDDAYGA